MEDWRPIIGIASKLSYEVSSCGRVRSLGGRAGSRYYEARILKPVLHHTGYLQLKLGGTKIYRVHQLVAWAFLGPQPVGMVINHIDGNKGNNTPENLEYITSSDNVKHAYRTGLLNNDGESNGKAVLTEEKVRMVMALPLSMPEQEAADLIGCKPFHIGRIRRGQTWRHITRSSSP